jgi:hypothetical protein
MVCSLNSNILAGSLILPHNSIVNFKLLDCKVHLAITAYAISREKQLSQLRFWPPCPSSSPAL